MKPSAILGTVAALVIALAAVAWINSNSNAAKSLKPVTPAAPATDDEHAATGEEPEDDGKWYKVNPLTPAASPPYPKIVIPDPEYNFGQMTFGDTETHDYTIRNEGEGPLKLARGPSTCSCTLPRVEDTVVPPGGSLIVKLQRKPKVMQEHFRQTATIWSDDPENPATSLIVEGEIVPEAILLPPGSLNFGEIEQGVAAKVTGEVFSRNPNFEIKSIETSNDNISAESTPVAVENIDAHKAAKGYRVTLTLAAGQDVGIIHDWAVIHTNLSGDNAAMRWDLAGSRPGPVKLVGRDWYASRQMVTMGRFPATEGSSVSLSMFVSKADQPLELTGVKTDSPIKVAIDPKPVLSLEKREQYRLVVEFPAGGLSGFHPLEDPVAVVVNTNHPLIPTLTFFVVYDAY